MIKISSVARLFFSFPPDAPLARLVEQDDSIAKNGRFVIKAGRLPPLVSYRESTVAESDPFKWRHYHGYQ
jgi:hypothetical protein